ncbi:hypothetical protein GCM10018775_07070 [Streptomyces umbrinus]|nr:hypothetical protein GCM10018775_07070 [Streptomyces umbrinus]
MPNAPAPSAAVMAICVALSPSADWILKSGRIPASASMVTVDTAHTATLRQSALTSRRHLAPLTPRPPPPRSQTCPNPVTSTQAVSAAHKGTTVATHAHTG